MGIGNSTTTTTTNTVHNHYSRDNSAEIALQARINAELQLTREKEAAFQKQTEQLNKEQAELQAALMKKNDEQIKLLQSNLERMEKALEQERLAQQQRQDQLAKEFRQHMLDMQENAEKEARRAAEERLRFEKEIKAQQEAAARMKAEFDQQLEQAKKQSEEERQQLIEAQKIAQQKQKEEAETLMYKQRRSAEEAFERAQFSQNQISQLDSGYGIHKSTYEKSDRLVAESLSQNQHALNLATDKVILEKEKSEIKTSQSSKMGSTLSKATADKEKIIIMLSGSDVSPEDADKCAKIFSSSAPSLKTAVEALFSSIKGKTLPEFKLNPGCSIVCPLIAFLEGSGGDKPEMTTRKGNCEAHQVTYNFGMENISSSKLKVASFAPLQQ